MAANDDIIGNGWRFPIDPDPAGGLGYVSGEQNIEQSLRILLQTDHGQRVMRSDFGCIAGRLVFAPSSEHFLRELERAVREAVRDWEPRVDLDDVRAELSLRDETIALVTVVYRIRASNTRENLVFPFYLRDAGAPQ
ncbi:GPW/gp25 family protein [Paraburkholderia terrae]